MKQINLENLHLRLPADSNFIEFVNSAAKDNIIALCRSLFPGDRAFVLYGLENPSSPLAFTVGAIYYKGEIYFVDAFNYMNTVSLSFCIREVVTKVTYMLSGEELPAYIDKKIFPIMYGENDPIDDALRLGNLIRLPAMSRTLIFNDSGAFYDFDGTIQTSPLLNHMLINFDVVLRGMDARMLRFELPLNIKIADQYLGYVTIVCEGINTNGLTSMGIVAEKKYKLFAQKSGSYCYLCITESSVQSFTAMNECVRFGAIYEHFRNAINNNFPFRVLFHHQVIAQI